MTWLPAIPVYMQLGFEALQGDNGLIANQLAARASGPARRHPGPRLFTGFLKMSPDSSGYSNTLQAGLSMGRSRSHHEADSTGPFVDVFDGSAWFLGTDWVWRHDSSRPYGEGDLTVQGDKHLSLQDAGAGESLVDPHETTSRQDGLYAQVVYGVGPRWTVAGRASMPPGSAITWEALTGTTDLGAATRYAANVTFNPTEFSRSGFL